MWKAGNDVKMAGPEDDDDEWETDPDFEVSIKKRLLFIGLL